MTKTLADLPAPLDRSHLHVFVVGPGVGEGIAVALPERGWLLIDGCRTSGDPTENLPLLAIYKRWKQDRDDPVHWMILTHPHEDHANGFAEVLGEVNPRAVGLMGPPPPAQHLLDTIRASEDLARRTEESVKNRQVLAAAKAMESWESRGGGTVVGLHSGCSLALDALDAMVRAPDPELGARLLDRGWPHVRRRANELSLVVELVFGSTRVVLGGDLPRVRWTGRHTTTEVATGWKHVFTRHPHLAHPHGLKVPHHASRDALHEGMVSPEHQTALWVTPYSSSRLPSADPEHGLRALLGSRPSVMLTALPTHRDHQPAHSHPARVSLDEYASLVSAPVAAGFLADAFDIRPPLVDDELSPVWCTALDDNGNVLGSWRGDVALEVVP